MAKAFYSLCPWSRLNLLRELIEGLTIDGAAAEVGVYKGGSALVIAEAAPDRTVHLFDTFRGIPDMVSEHDNHHKAGDFADASLDDAKRMLADCRNVEFHVGVFPETAGPVADRKFAFVHVDCDIYRSVWECCKFFYPRMNAGGIMVFDDYHAWSCVGAKIAVDNFFADKPEEIALPTIEGGGCYVVVGGE